MRNITSPLAGFGSPFGRRRGGGAAQVITATIAPALGALEDGDTIASAMSADYDQTSNYASTAGTISTVVAAVTVNGSPALFTDTVEAGDVVAVTVTVTDSESNERVFNGGTRTVADIAPVATGGIADQSYTEDVAITPLDVSTDFTGTRLTFALAPSSDALPAGLSLSSAGELTGTPTTVAAEVNIVVRATNSAGTADTAFGVTITEASAVAYDVEFGTTLADFTPGTVDAAIATRIDASGNGNTGTQIVTAARSVLRLDGSNYYEEFDGIDDRRQFAADASWRKAGMSVIMVARFNAAASGGSRVVFGGNNTYGVLYQAGGISTTVSAGPGFNTFYKNGNLITGTITRDALYTAWVIDDWVILEAAGGDLSAAGFDTHFQYPGWRDDDNLAACDIADMLILPTADADANRAAIVSELATKWGITI